MAYRNESTRQAAGEAILELARNGMDIAAISADTGKAMFTTLLKEEYPDRFFDVGIAEQNMMTAAAGMAATGKTVFAASYSVFTSMRCCEQLRTFIAYPGLNVKIIAGIGGFSAGIEGVTHVATEDLGIVRCIPNMAVVAPADSVTVRKAVRAAAEYHGPVYIRIGREPSPVLFNDEYDFQIGRTVIHRRGSDITIVGCGLVMAEVFRAADLLNEKGISAGVIEVHTLKPVMNAHEILQEIMYSGKVITVEEHNVIGGLGTVISEILAGAGPVKIKKLGLQDAFAESGTPEELVFKYGVDSGNIAEEAMKLIKC